jgi:ABC-type spermidine/putrescine transport system permease subunit I
MRYSVANNTAFSNMTNISFTAVQIAGFNVSVRTNDNAKTLGQDRNQTFWKVNVPLSVGGNCNGTLVFGAIVA